MTFASLIAFAFALAITVRLRRQLAGLTILTAHTWAVIALGAAIFATALRLVPMADARTVSAMHYFAATLLLIPPMDVLGARNPGHRVWPWFVLLPLMLVLQWPAASQVISQGPESPVEIPTPTTIGYCLVLFMGGGNYLGTKNTVAAVFGMSAVVLFVLPATEWSAWPGNHALLAAGLCLAVSVTLVVILGGPPADSGGIQDIWITFRDLYGLVWAKRVMDRINQFAERENWDVTMTLDGFRPKKQLEPSKTGSDRREAVLKWLLRRFADEQYLDRFLSCTSTANPTDPASATDSQEASD